MSRDWGQAGLPQSDKAEEKESMKQAPSAPYRLLPGHSFIPSLKPTYHLPTPFYSFPSTSTPGAPV